MEIGNLIILTCGETDILSKKLCAEGIRQSETVAIKIASMAGTKKVTMIFPNSDGPIRETGNIVFSKVHERSKFIMPQYVNEHRMINVWYILDAIYSYQDDVVILIMLSSHINQLMKYFCEDNDIPLPSSQTIGYCSGYEIDCVNRKCTPFDWSRAIESQAACPY